MSDERRPYRKRRRAELEEETRLRITESAVALHGSHGPSRTSMSAVAEHAGVPRSTLYRHFPDEEALFDACSAHFTAANPPPDIAEWAGIEDPDERVRAALGDMYAYYRRTETMTANLLRDIEVPLVGSRVGPFLGYLDAVRDVLLRGRPRRRAVRAAVGHALAFSTWQSLARDQQLDDRQAVELMCRLVAAASEPSPAGLRDDLKSR
jgi:AcrR family transcriptional regulator